MPASLSCWKYGTVWSSRRFQEVLRPPPSVTRSFHWESDSRLPFTGQLPPSKLQVATSGAQACQVMAGMVPAAQARLGLVEDTLAVVDVALAEAEVAAPYAGVEAGDVPDLVGPLDGVAVGPVLLAGQPVAAGESAEVVDDVGAGDARRCGWRREGRVPDRRTGRPG